MSGQILDLDGGQGGYNIHLENQSFKSSSSAKPDIENSGEFGSIPNHVQPRVREAAMWLHLNRNTISGNVIVGIRRRFALTVMEAVEASKFAHSLDFSGA